MNLHRRLHRLLLDAQPGAPPISGGGTRSAFTGGAKLDANMVIILAALLCALICALGLNLIVRFALRCSRGEAFEAPEETSERLAAKGMRKSALRGIPVTVYGTDTGVSATDCAICLGEFVDGEKVRVMPRCRHGFHVRCIDIWLAAHSSCPNCRTLLFESPSAASDVDAEMRQPGHTSGDQGDTTAEEVG